VGQKVNPLALRIGYIENWRSLWFADKKQFAQYILEDYNIRQFIKKRFVQAAVSKVVIERLGDKIRVIIHTARPGVIIGRRGADIDKLRAELGEITSKEIAIDPQEIKNPSIDAQLIAQNIALQLDIAGCLPEISVDEGKLRQVFINLISNALKFKPSVSIKEGISSTVDYNEKGKL